MLTGFVCAVEGDDVSFDFCLRCSLKEIRKGCPYPHQVLSAMASEVRNQKGISTTGIIQCLRKTYLQMKEDYYVAPSDLYPAFRGQMIHSIMDRVPIAEEQDLIKERNYQVDIDGVTFSGRVDVFSPRLKLLIDYKTTVNFPKYGKAYKSHSLQVNIYRWLLEKNGFPIDRIEIVYMNMRDILRIPVKLMDIDTLTDYIYSRVSLLNFALQSNTPPPAEISNLCSYCHVKEFCDKIEQENIYKELKEKARRHLKGHDLSV